MIQLSPDSHGDLAQAKPLAAALGAAIDAGIPWIYSINSPASPPPRQPRESRGHYLARLLLSGHWELRIELHSPLLDGGTTNVHLTRSALLWGLQKAAAGHTLNTLLHDGHGFGDALQFALFGYKPYP